MINFSFLCPTRDRVQLAYRLFQSIIDTTAKLDQIEVVLAVDEDDIESQNITCDRFKITKTILPKGSTMGALDQACFDASCGRYVAGMNDDVIIRTKNWDQIVLNAFAMYPDDIALIHINDMIFQEKLCTFPILSRRACLEIGLCPTGYKRYRIDDHIYDIYNMLAYLGHKRIVYLPDVIFEHENYQTDKGKTGETFVGKNERVYAPNLEIINQDAKLFDEKAIERKLAAMALARLIDDYRFQHNQEKHQAEIAGLHPASRIFPYRALLSSIKDPFSYRREDFVKKLPASEENALKSKRVTIAVVTANINNDFAAKCISLIKEHTANYDLIILDNNKGFDFSHPHEMNKILRIVDTDYLVLMDDDIYVEKGWLTGLMKCMNDDTAVVIPIHKDRRGNIDYTGGYLAGDGRGTHAHLTDMPPAPREVQGLCSAIMLIDLTKVGDIFMDEKYSKYFFDIIYGLQVWEAGYKVVVTPEVAVTHLGGATMIRGTQEASGLWNSDTVVFISEWINSDRMRKLSNIWRTYEALNPLVAIPEKIHDVFSHATELSGHDFEENLTNLIVLSEPYPLFENLIGEKAQQYIPVLIKENQREKAKVCQAAIQLLIQRRAGKQPEQTKEKHAPVTPQVIQTEEPGDQSSILVSAIVSTYNSEKFMRGLLEDLEAQTIRDRMEIIVIDSGSLQKESAIVAEFQKKYPNISYTRTKRENSHVTFNRGLELARGKYVTMANTDDRHHPDAFRKMVEVLEKRPDIGVVYFDSAVTQTPNTTLEKGPITGRFRWPDFNRRLLFQVCFIGPQPMWRKSLHDQYGLLDPEFVSAGDYEWWLRISDKTGFFHIPQVLGLYFESAASNEHKDPVLSQNEAEKARQRYWKSIDGPRPTPREGFLERYNIQIPDEYKIRYPFVSVIVPTHDRPAELKTALDSIAAQTYPNVEIIVINDAGQDVTHIIKRFEGKCNIRYETHSENRGAGAARNTGMKLAKGKYIAFLDDDDIYYPEHIFSLVSELETNQSLVAAYTDGLQVTRDATNPKHKVLDKRVTRSMDFSTAHMLVANYIPNLCLMFRREAMEKANLYFDESMPALEDWEWLIRLALVGPFSHLAFVTNEYVVWKGKKTRNILKPEQIQSLYQKVYAKYNHLTSPEIQEAQNNCYYQMTGRYLKEDAPLLFSSVPAVSETPPASAKAVETLTLLLQSEDLPAALLAHEKDLDAELLKMVRLNAQTAQADGKQDLAQGLENLAAYINNVIDSRSVAAPVDQAVATFQQLLSADDLLTALQENENKLDNDLLHLVKENERSARRDGETELADGLNDLANYIEQVIANRIELQTSRYNPEETLRILLDAEDIVTALKDNRNRLDEDLLELVRANIRAAIAEGNQDLAEGLENLADFIQQVLDDQTQIEQV
jgi:glycosyltransferase involved in cell wall biosynthesis